ncbi:unnamed protein product [Oikopleura dioica]|uniref:Uncharacterized protein n=1 Tax=Oikopleura dioica TaxID=34765 RepID=E4XMY2_OIKDI|nr:unnamed protein product [Oikopleura dioica]
MGQQIFAIILLFRWFFSTRMVTVFRSVSTSCFQKRGRILPISFMKRFWRVAALNFYYKKYDIWGQILLTHSSKRTNFSLRNSRNLDYRPLLKIGTGERKSDTKKPYSDLLNAIKISFGSRIVASASPNDIKKSLEAAILTEFEDEELPDYRSLFKTDRGSRFNINSHNIGNFIKHYDIVMEVLNNYKEKKAYAKKICRMMEADDADSLLLVTSTTFLFWHSISSPLLAAVGKNNIEFRNVLEAMKDAEEKFDYIGKVLVSDFKLCVVWISPFRYFQFCEININKEYNKESASLKTDQSTPTLFARLLKLSEISKIDDTIKRKIQEKYEKMSTAEKDQIDAEIRASLKDMRRKFSEEYKAYKELKIKDEDRISPNNNAVESSFAILKQNQVGDFSTKDVLIQLKTRVFFSKTGLWLENMNHGRRQGLLDGLE